MLLLGHACWAYVTGRLAGYGVGTRPNLYLLLFVGMIPDFDLVLGIFGVPHRTFTHSVLVWTIVFIPLLAKYKTRAIPYFVAVVQHILLGDLIVGRTSIFWPFVEPRLGLALPILSPVNLALEAAGLAIFVVMGLRNHELFSQQKSYLALLPVLPIILFVVLASFGGLLLPLIMEGSDARHLERNIPALLQNPNLQAAVVMHLALSAVILTSFARARLKPRTVGV